MVIFSMDKNGAMPALIFQQLPTFGGGPAGKGFGKITIKLALYEESDVWEKLANNVFNDPLIVESWHHIFKELKAGKIDTWDYQLGLTNYFNNGLCIIPNYNLVSNIGFGYNATHTTETGNSNANIPL